MSSATPALAALQAKDKYNTWKRCELEEKMAQTYIEVSLQRSPVSLLVMKKVLLYWLPFAPR
jgi:hypothetical protein